MGQGATAFWRRWDGSMSSAHESAAIGRLRVVEEADLRLLLSWRNDVDVRRFMFTSREIEWDEHCAWYRRCMAEAGRQLLIFEADGVGCGFMNLSGIGRGRVADWGFFVAPGAPRGTGLRMGAATLNRVFNQYGVHKLCGQAISNNDRSVRFHRRLGFRQEDVLRDQHLCDGTHVDIICFGLLASKFRSSAIEKDET